MERGAKPLGSQVNKAREEGGPPLGAFKISLSLSLSYSAKRLSLSSFSSTRSKGLSLASPQVAKSTKAPPPLFEAKWILAFSFSPSFPFIPEIKKIKPPWLPPIGTHQKKRGQEWLSHPPSYIWSHPPLGFICLHGCAFPSFLLIFHFNYFSLCIHISNYPYYPTPSKPYANKLKGVSFPLGSFARLPYSHTHTHTLSLTHLKNQKINKLHSSTQRALISFPPPIPTSSN